VTSEAVSGALTPARPAYTMRPLSGFLASHAFESAIPPDRLHAPLMIDPEPAVIRLCLPVRRLRRDRMRIGALATEMPTSGATVERPFAHQVRSAPIGSNQTE
jgi:hypothetical protein